METFPTHREQPKILREPWKEIPEHFVSVFHYTDQSALEPISKEGLTHFTERVSINDMSPEEKTRMTFDNLCDSFANRLGIPFERAKAVFAAIDDETTSTWSHFGDVTLEIKTDPDTTYVYDRTLHTAASIAWGRTPEGQQGLTVLPEQREEFEKLQKQYPENFEFYLEEYLKRRMSLTKYNALSEKEKQECITKPEVALPSPVNPKFIRIV
jgi:hypothetical protein